MKKILSTLILMVLLASSGCGMMDDLKEALAGINVGVDMNANINTTSGLDQDTLERIDAVNETIATGVEVGPETRDLIRELNETIENGIKAGFDEATLSRVDELLRVVEDGLKIGLDDETLETIDGMVDTIDRMPANWEATALDIIQTLENTAGSTAKTLAEQVEGLMKEARINYQQMVSITGVEFRCNVDFMGSKMGATAQEFIGKSIVGKLKNIIAGKSYDESIPIPWVCQIIPDQMVLSKVGNKLVFTEGIITLIGYNYVSANAPSAKIVDESGNPVQGINLYPYLSSPYQIQLNLQDLDMSSVPPRSRVMFTWPNVQESSGIAILMPGYAEPIADFTADKFSGSSPLTVQFTDTSKGDPVEWKWVFGDGSTSHEQNPSHTFMNSRSYLVQLTVSNGQGESSVIKTVSVDVALTADFKISKTSGDVGLNVNFTDKSEGGPTSWLWDFGDGTPTSTEQNPTHTYMAPNPDGYQVKLTVSNQSGSASYTAPDRVKIFEPLVAKFTMDKSSGNPPFDVKFTDSSTGGASIIGRTWDFGDGTPPVQNQNNPTHTYTATGSFTVTLKITRADGSTDDEIASINSFRKFTPGMLINPAIKALFQNPYKQETVYFTSFNIIPGGTPRNTNISSQKYICGVVGMEANFGIIWPLRVAKDSLRVYMYPNAQTWWILAEFSDIDPGSDWVEKWNINVACFNKEMVGKTIYYTEDFRNISGGTPKETNLKTEDYFNCGIIGVAGLGVTGFRPNWYSGIALDQTVIPQSGKWVINSDMDIFDGGDLWDVKLLCFVGGDFNNVEKPPIIVKRVNIPTSVTTTIATEISSNEYICGVNGYKAERVELYAAYFPIFDQRNVASTVLSVRTYPQNGFWTVEGNIANRNKGEDFTVDLFCVKKGIAVEGIPPN